MDREDTMTAERVNRGTTRREILRLGTGAAGAALAVAAIPGAAQALAAKRGYQLQGPGTSADRINGMRNQMAAVPLETKKLRDNLQVIYNGAGNVVLLTGSDGKLISDTSVLPNAPKLLAQLAAIDSAPLKLVVNTHWHFDHTDGNDAMHNAGATIIAHENTLKRLSTRQEIKGFGLTFDPAPVGAWPRTTFSDKAALYFGSENVHLGYIQPAHTDSDIYVHFEKANVIHGGDVFFAGRYPFIDASTGGSINGMIAGADKLIAMAGADTVVVPGHGPVGDRGTLTTYRDMMVTVRDRVRAQKTAGKTLEEVVAAKLTADFDAAWGGSMVSPELFTTVVYTTL
jgi:glyoxylase-like metal-dependent hydrolase (beta-lactamase superfamily II)